MSKPRPASDLHRQHHEEWRDPSQVAGHWSQADALDPRLFESETKGRWWETLAECGITLLVTREYEHLVMALRAAPRGGHVSYMALPHPSGLVVDRERAVVHIASTRNPNKVFELRPVAGLKPRLDAEGQETDRELVPVRARYYPGCLYIHDLALFGGVLHANAVGENAVVRLDDDGRAPRVWWPKCIEVEGAPVFGRNHIQLNSIAAGDDPASSYYSASSSAVSRLRPGHLKYPVDRRGVIFSGATREPIARGLTRPHSARFGRGEVWAANSGYGELGFAREGGFEVVARLPGWTRGLCIVGDLAFIGTSRVLPRFRAYAPGLDVDSSRCGVHAVDLRTGEVRGSFHWPHGNQIFALDWLPGAASSGFPWVVGRRRPARTRGLFYAFTTEPTR